MQVRNGWSRFREDDGFTLVELLVVIAVLGILAAVSVFALNGTATSSKRAACKTDVQTVQAASDAYYVKNGSYTTSLATLVSDGELRSQPGNASSYTITISSGAASATTPAGGCSAVA